MAYRITGVDPANFAALRDAEEGDAAIRDLFDAPEIAYIDVHNPAAGCFAARVERN